MNEALARKQRSEAILRAEGVPFLPTLPVVENETTLNLRYVEAVAWRAQALCLVALKGEGLEQDKILRFLREYELYSALTPKERKFIYDETPLDHDRIQFAWRYECYWVLLWALSYVDDLGRPDHICDVPMAVKIMFQRSACEFIRDAQLRTSGEILDVVDVIYRYDWACVEARLKGREAPAGLDSGVVMERHHALNWLVGYMDQEWDDVTTDT